MEIFPFLLALLTATLPAEAGTPTASDIAAVQQFVARDRSYSLAARAEAERRAETLTKYLGDPPRFELEVARIVALADNGHTAMFPTQWTLRYPRSPVRLGIFADGLFVIAAPPELSEAVGQPVATVNGTGWREARTKLSVYQGGSQGFRDQFLPYLLETPALLTAAGVGKDAARLTLTFANGRQLSVEPVMAPLAGEEAMLGAPMLRDASAAVRGDKPLYLQHPDHLYQFATLPELSAAYVRLDAIGGANLEAFLADSLGKLRSGSQSNIILDLRFNMGGDLNRARDFAQALPGLARGGRVYVITSGRTFSAAISTTGYIKQAGADQVRIVGEPVGDRLEFWAEGNWSTLPGTGSTLLHATERHNYQTGCPEADCHRSIRDHPIRVNSVQPDLQAPLRFAEFAAGRDPAMEAIARDISAQR